MSQRNKTICVDLDGVIHQYNQGFGDGQLYGDMVEGAGPALAKLVKEGYTIVIQTTRLNSRWYKDDAHYNQAMDKIVDWLADHNLLRGSHWHEITGQKPPAIAYIDDRGIRFTNWTDIRKHFC